MMRDNQDIKDQIRKMRDILNSTNPIVKEDINDIKKKYLIKEDVESETIATKYNVPTAVEDEIEDSEPM